MQVEYTIMLNILSPEKRVFSGLVSRLTLPGAKSPFTILHNHAPIISLLNSGAITWIAADGQQQLEIKSGFVEAKDNKVTICAEI